MRRAALARWTALGGASLLAATLALACNDDTANRDFANALAAQNERWVERGERPLANLALRLASNPATIAERRVELTAELAPIASLLDEVIAATQGYRAPAKKAQACHDAQVRRLDSERRWVSDLRTALDQGQDATASATVFAFADVARLIAQADETCSQFIDSIN